MLKDFNKLDSGTFVEHLVILKDDKDPNKTFMLHGLATQLHEVQSGFTNTKDHYQQTILVVTRFIEEYQNN